MAPGCLHPPDGDHDGLNASCDRRQEADFLNGFPLVLHGGVDIQPQSRLDVRVAQHFRQAFYIYAAINTARGVGMPNGVKIAVLHTAAFQQCMEPALTGARLHGLIRTAR